MQSTYVQSTLNEFVKLTGYQMYQSVIRLNHTWRSNRTRWWCVLSYPLLQVQDIPQMPRLDVEFHVSHLMQIQPTLDEKTMTQLKLSTCESMHFHQQKGGITKSIINTNASMPTATHSWGSQTQGCKCGCRKSGFSAERLQAKGLYGVLIPIGTMFVENEQTYHDTRHPDPREMALLVGLSPAYLKTAQEFELRFLMAGVGQCASPLQGPWVLGNILTNLKYLGDQFDFPNPHVVIGQMGVKLTNERFQCWPNQEHTIKTRVFVDQLEKLCRSKPLQVEFPIGTIHKDDPKMCTDSATSHTVDSV